MAAQIAQRIGGMLVPGGLLLLLSFALLQAPFLSAGANEFAPYYTIATFALGLVLSLAFHRSRIFFGLLALLLADVALLGAAPQMNAAVLRHTLFDLVALLIPINLLCLSFALDRGILTEHGKWQLAALAAQALLVAALCFAHAGAFLDFSLFDGRLLSWNHLPQLALVAFAFTAAWLLFRLAKERNAFESGLLWALVSAFVALNANDAAHVAAYLATGGLALTLAVLETSYSMAYRDELTGIPSRRAFNEALLKLGEDYAIAMVDVDHFKQFNDTFGHATGDQVLRMVAGQLRGVAGGGRAFRYGGEEFAVIFPGLTAREALPHLVQLRKQIEGVEFKLRNGVERRKRTRRSQSDPGRRRRERRRPAPQQFVLPHNKKSAAVTVSIGVACANGEGFEISPEEIVRAADRALYRAKSNGRNCVVAG